MVFSKVSTPLYPLPISGNRSLPATQNPLSVTTSLAKLTIILDCYHHRFIACFEFHINRIALHIFFCLAFFIQHYDSWGTSMFVYCYKYFVFIIVLSLIIWTCHNPVVCGYSVIWAVTKMLLCTLAYVSWCVYIHISLEYIPWSRILEP